MVSLKEKVVNGKRYRYASRSVRLPDGRVATVEKILKKSEKATSSGVRAVLLQKEKDLFTRDALQRYCTGSVFTAAQISKIEGMRIDYRRIIRSLTKRQLQDLFDRFTVNFTYESNALEGNSLTLKDVAIIIGENVVPKDKDLREVYDTRNSRKVVDLILKKRLSVSEKEIITMHRMLVKDMNIPAGFKHVPNFIAGSHVQTSSPERVRRDIAALLSWIAANPQKLHPLQLAVLAHGKFERIHPFEDGNGRVGRFLFNVMLVNNNYPPVIIRKTQRTAYLNALQDFDEGHPQTLERFLLAKYKETFRKFFGVYVRYIT
ncbi:MAG: Fic family protein [Nanoarchaeota archaeon]|nr:Fic family protein [Nanoarchaeota archaeon]